MALGSVLAVLQGVSTTAKVYAKRGFSRPFSNAPACDSVSSRCPLNPLKDIKAAFPLPAQTQSLGRAHHFAAERPSRVSKWRTGGETLAGKADGSALPMPLETRGISDRTFPGKVRVKRDEAPLETVVPPLAGL